MTGPTTYSSPVYPPATVHPSIPPHAELSGRRYHPYSAPSHHKHNSPAYHAVLDVYEQYPPRLVQAYTDDASIKMTDRVRRKCFNCSATDTTTWRRSSLSAGKVVCNKCGLFERTHGRPRPPMLPTKKDTKRLGRHAVPAPVFYPQPQRCIMNTRDPVIDSPRQIPPMMVKAETSPTLLSQTSSHRIMFEEHHLSDEPPFQPAGRKCGIDEPQGADYSARKGFNA